MLERIRTTVAAMPMPNAAVTDVEIAKRLGLNRSTVQYRRTSTLEQLRKIMEENGYEYHKQ